MLYAVKFGIRFLITFPVATALQSEDLAQNDELGILTPSLFFQPLQPMVSVNQLTVGYYACDPTFGRSLGFHFIKVLFVGDHHVVDL